MINSKFIFTEVRIILIRYWDPIGVYNILEAQDEYDIYIPEVVKKIINNKNIQNIADFLVESEKDMGLIPNGKRALDVAIKISKINFNS